MRRDPDVFLIGVDVAHNRGAHKVTQGLLDEFGPERVVNAPALEQAFAGLALGAAMSGLKPVVEYAGSADALETLHLIVATAAETYYLSGGTVAVPIVFRIPCGGSSGATGAEGSCHAATFANVPGLKVLAPATPADAKGLLKSAIRDPAPVVVLEQEGLYDYAGLVPGARDWVTPIGTARIARAGRDVSIVTYGRAFLASLAAAQVLEVEGIGAEVVDLRTLRPLDLAAVTASVSRTRRGWSRSRTAGPNAESAPRLRPLSPPLPSAIWPLRPCA
jgi:pyruvate dehydrogenase E1 component beta subunit